MAEDTLKNVLYGFVFLTLFMFLMLTFVVDVARDNGKDTTDFKTGAFSLEPYSDFLGGVDDNAEAFRERFEEGNIFSVVAGIVVDGIFGIVVDMVIFVTTPFTLIAQILTNVVGVPVMVTSVILGLLVITVIFGIWRLVKVGD